MAPVPMHYDTYLFLLNTNSMVNLAWPPLLTHWSMKTSMSLPVTMKMVRAKEAVLNTMLLDQEEGEAREEADWKEGKRDRDGGGGK